MPLFSRHSVEDERAHPFPIKTVEVPQRHNTLFGRHSSVSSSSTAATAHSTHSAGSTGHRGILHRHDADPSIRAAQERVLSAEAAEREADKALLHARTMVKEAREHVKKLEREAAEEARLAKIKQEQAASISKRARPLGRHDK